MTHQGTVPAETPGNAPLTRAESWCLVAVMAVGLVISTVGASILHSVTVVFSGVVVLGLAMIAAGVVGASRWKRLRWIKRVGAVGFLLTGVGFVYIAARAIDRYAS